MTDPTDIVDDLRAALTERQKEMRGGGALYRRAADEIERLRRVSPFTPPTQEDRDRVRRKLNELDKLRQERDELVAEIERLRGENDWEYSIGYSCIDLKGNRFWTDDGLGVMDRETAEEEMRTNRDSYLSGDHVVRRRPAGPWERVPEGEGDE